MRSNLKAILAAAAVAASAAVFCVGPAQATFTFLNGVGVDENGLPATFIIGDKLFSNFTCLGAGTGVNVGCEGVSFAALTDGQFGVKFNAAGELDFTDASGESRDVTFEFQVSTISGAALIADFFLNSNAATSGSATVSDNLRICLDQGCATVIFGPQLLSGDGFSIADFLLAGGPYASIWIEDDVHTASGDAPGTVDVSVINKVVTQTTPEPASLLLLASGLVGLGWFRRRANRA